MGKGNKLKGTNDDDILIVGPEITKVDGKKGIDFATVSGSIEDFTFEAKGKNKLNLFDDDGNKVEFKKVEWIVFDGDTPGDTSDDVYYNVATGTELRLDASVDDSAQTVGGNLLVGSGIPASDFVTVDNTALGLELGLQVIYRQGPSVDPVSLDANGAVHFTVNDGAQSTVNGSSSNNPNRAAWSFEYSIATGIDGAATDLSDYTFTLKIDIDPGAGTDFRTFTMTDAGGPYPNPTGYIWIDENNVPTIGDDGGNANVAQNSENFAFGFIESFIDADPNTPGIQSYAPDFGPAQFDIILEAHDSGGDLVASNHIIVDVFDFV